METDAIALAQKIQLKFASYKQQSEFSQIAKLITFSFQVLPREYNQQIFGYIPHIFRQVTLKDHSQLQQQDIFIGEPVVYKIYFPNQQRLYDLSYFYIFCYFKANSQQLNVYFQSAHPKYKSFTQDEYHLSQEKVKFEGSMSAFKPHNISIISVSDPGHFIPGFTSSYYAGSPEINFNQLIAEVLEKICNLANISLKDTMFFGSSAGTFGALLSSTYLKEKTNVLAVNSQIVLQHRNQLMNFLFNTNQAEKLVEKYGNQLSCTYRFRQKINAIPNIYLMANINDHLHQRNFDFYKLYISRFTRKGANNQSVFDSYDGIEGHGRPEPNSLRRKIEIAREILTMKSTIKD